MGKVKEGISVSTPSKAGKGKSGGSSKGLLASLLVPTWPVPTSTSRCRGGTPGSTPQSGWDWSSPPERGRFTSRHSSISRLWRFGIPAAFAAILGWIVFRIVHFPPFAEFLIATEAEMNKVSWTSKDDLIRATTVVLTTVVLMAVFLFRGRHALDFHPSNDRSASVHRRRRIRIDGLKRPASGRAYQRARGYPAGGNSEFERAARGSRRRDFIMSDSTDEPIEDEEDEETTSRQKRPLESAVEVQEQTPDGGHAVSDAEAEAAPASEPPGDRLETADPRQKDRAQPR